MYLTATKGLYSRLRVRRAFTLVELLAVLAIIGVLAGLIYSLVGSTRDKAKGAKCASNLRQIGIAMQVYAIDHKGRFPAAYNSAEGAWSNALTAQGYLPLINTVFQCPSDPYSPLVPRPRSYVYCSLGMFNGSGEPDNYSNTTYQQQISKVSRPARTFMITEWHWNQQDVKSLNGAWASWDIVNGAAATSSVGHPAGARNFLYMDGHVAFLRPDQCNQPSMGWKP